MHCKNPMLTSGVVVQERQSLVNMSFRNITNIVLLKCKQTNKLCFCGIRRCVTYMKGMFFWVHICMCITHPPNYRNLQMHKKTRWCTWKRKNIENGHRFKCTLQNKTHQHTYTHSNSHNQYNVTL